MEIEILVEIATLMAAGAAYLRRVIRAELAPVVERVAALELRLVEPTEGAPDITRPIHLDTGA